jgi:hypothetical protein
MQPFYTWFIFLDFVSIFRSYLVLHAVDEK